MKNLIYGLLIFVMSLPAFGQDNPSIEGNWLGALDLGGAKLRLVLKVSKAADGTFSAKFDSPDQGATDLPVDAIAQKEKTVSFSAAKYGINYEGTLNEKGDEITGNLKRGDGGLVPLVFKRTGEI